MSQRSAIARRTRRGFTLIEVGVMIGVAVMLAMIAIPTLNSISGANARASVSKLASNIRATRGKAAVSGQTCRIVFDLDDNSYSIECAEGYATVAYERELGGRRADSNNRNERLLEEEDVSRLSEKERTKLEILRKSQFAPKPFMPPQSLQGLEFDNVWTQHQEEAFHKGKAYLYFFPNGVGEQANIQLTDGDDEWFSLHVSALGGRVRVLPEKKDLPVARGWED